VKRIVLKSGAVVETKEPRVGPHQHNHINIFPMTRSTIYESRVVPARDLSLGYLVQQPKLASTKRKAIVLLHGVGSNEQDLFSLSNQLPGNYFIISPRGPFTLGNGRYAWYNVDFSTGKPIIHAEQEIRSRELIMTFIKEIKSKYHLHEVYLGGFSQGAIMSYSIGLAYPGEVQGIVSLSGRILEEIKPMVKKDDQLQHLKVMVAHGVEDNTLPIHYAREAKTYLESLGVQLTYHEYQTGHQVTHDVLTDLNDWLDNQ
jgi:phospholipase/carboxylesterase